MREALRLIYLRQITEESKEMNIISRIPNEPNQAVINGLDEISQIKCWEHWLKLLQIEQNQGFTNNSVEVGSTVGGFNPIYNRFKITGQYSLEDIQNILIQKLQESIAKDTRTCARVFIPIPKNMDKKDFEDRISDISKNSDYTIEYAYYSENTQNQKGLIILFGKNEENRKVRKAILTSKNLQDYQDKIKNSNNQTNSDSFNEKDFREINLQNLTQIQRRQLTYYWRKFFGPGYNLSNTNKILDDGDIIKTIIVDQNGNIISACTGEIDNLGGIEITEFFAKSTFNHSKSGEFMLKRMIQKCQQKYPDLQIYMEANTSSGMPFTAIKTGFAIPKLENSVLQTEQIAIANVKVGSFEENTYNNFALLRYE